VRYFVLSDRAAVISLSLLLLGLLSLGCHRGFYRRQADAEAAMLIAQKACDPRWNQVDPTIDIDPRSRMFDPFSADHPPLPPDDPASHKLMEVTDSKRNYPHWHANGETCYVENPEWVSYIPMNDQGQLVLDLETAVFLGLLNSPDYQSQKETLYLSALNVALERFGFDSQLLAGFNGFLRANGPDRGGQSTIGLEGNNIGLQQLGTTGTTVAAGLANSILWNLTGVTTQSATTVLDFSVIQPLLRGAGRDRVLAALTQAERDLLADVRQMERFRRGFYLFVTTGRNPGQGPGASAFGLPGAAQNNAGGLLGLLQTLQSIRIDESNVREQEEILEQFRAFFQEERIDLLQVTQVEGNLFQAQRRLANSRTNYENALDRFKIDLGLPPDLPVVIRDPFLDQFELISDEVFERRNEIRELRDHVSVYLTTINELARSRQFDTEPEIDGRQVGVEWTDEFSRQLDELLPVMEQFASIRDRVLERNVQEVRGDIEELAEARPGRIQDLRRLRQIVAENPEAYNIETRVLDENQIANPQEMSSQLETSLKKIEKLANEVQLAIDLGRQIQESGPTMSAKELYQALVLGVSRQTPEFLTQLSNLVLEISLIQARTRSDTISLPEVDLTWEKAVAIAKCFRRDWMNARAGLVDSWRQIEFFADQLESELDLVLEGDISNDGNNPFRFSGKDTSVRMGFQFDTPLNRQAERNQYRQALINYQRARRNYYQFKDEIKRNLRQTIRNIELNRLLFEVDRRSVRIAVQSVELARFDLEEPPEVRTALGGGSQLSQQTAINLTGALNSLQQTQNQFLNTWVNFEALRRGLDFDLGTMQMTPDGYWLDPGEITDSIGEKAAEIMGIPCEELGSCEIDPYHHSDANFFGSGLGTGQLDEPAVDAAAGGEPQSEGDESGEEIPPIPTPPASRELPELPQLERDDQQRNELSPPRQGEPSGAPGAFNSQVRPGRSALLPNQPLFHRR